MSHRHGSLPKPPFRIREAFPKMVRTDQGVQIVCPFCTPAHPLTPGEPASCGTTLKLTAEQRILPSRITRMNHVKCLKCQQEGGEMIQYMNGFVHLEECNPKTRLLPDLPKFNPMAGIVIKMPGGIRKLIEKSTGVSQAVHEIDGSGNVTGKVLGHFFMKNRGVANG
jgi:hypothetical protein